VEFTGPLGNFVLPEGDAPLLLVARFTGVVPFRAMLLALERGDYAARPVRLVTPLRSPMNSLTAMS
jgi:NAD(P)H-flavin reductase